MTSSLPARLVRATTFGLAVVLGPVSIANAATVVFPAGTACTFDVSVDITGGSTVQRVFKDKNGNVVRMLFAGLGSQLTFTNVQSGTTLALKANGSVTQVTNNPDNTSTYVTTGHNVLILFPTDVPAGPSTTLYVGQVVFTIDNISGVFTLQRTSGKSADICAALSS
jgi:hypothetical protein